jgi:holo-[acyl-carrier protein] synthase
LVLSVSTPSAKLAPHAIGCDVVAVERFVSWLQKRGSKGLQRLMTADEQVYCLSAPKLGKQAERIAARVAAKEAVAKLLGVGLNGMGYTEGLDWREVEVLPAMPRQGPGLRFHGKPSG